MSGDMPAIHIEALAAALSRGAVRTVYGRAYPVPEGELTAWLAQQQFTRGKRPYRTWTSKAAREALQGVFS